MSKRKFENNIVLPRQDLVYSIRVGVKRNFLVASFSPM